MRGIDDLDPSVVHSGVGRTCEQAQVDGVSVADSIDRLKCYPSDLTRQSLLTIISLALLVSFSMVRSAAAQPTSARDPNPLTVAVNAVGLVSIQPTDNTYVNANAPYLDQGLGAVGLAAARGLA